MAVRFLGNGVDLSLAHGRRSSIRALLGSELFLKLLKFGHGNLFFRVRDLAHALDLLNL